MARYQLIERQEFLNARKAQVEEMKFLREISPDKDSIIIMDAGDDIICDACNADVPESAVAIDTQRNEVLCQKCMPEEGKAQIALQLQQEVTRFLSDDTFNETLSMFFQCAVDNKQEDYFLFISALVNNEVTVMGGAILFPSEEAVKAQNLIVTEVGSYFRSQNIFVLAVYFVFDSWTKRLNPNDPAETTSILTGEKDASDFLDATENLIAYGSTLDGRTAMAKAHVCRDDHDQLAGFDDEKRDPYTPDRTTRPPRLTLSDWFWSGYLGK